MAAPMKARSFPLRSQLRLALLAAAEACWIYAAILVLGTLAGAAREVSPFGIFLAYWIALQTGRFLPRTRLTWRVLQALTIAIAVITVVATIRIGLYGELPLADMGWLPNYLGRLTMLSERGPAEQISTFALIFAFVRGLSFAQRALTLWTIGFQFRLGIVVFFGAAFVSAISYPVNFSEWVFSYFALSLPAIGLARIEEAGQERPLGFKWALVMLTAVGATMLLGFVVAQFFTLDAINALFELLSPLGFIVQIVVTLVAIPLFFLLNLLAQLLTPFFDFVRDMLQNLRPGSGGENPVVLQFLNEVTRIVVDLVPYLRLAGVILVVIFIGWLIARALSKRMEWQERELYARERIDDSEGFTPAGTPRARRGGFARHEIHAENVRRIYAALLVQAESAGLKRRDAETPLEFLPRLTAHFPRVAPALVEITNAYVAVHYAQHPASEVEVRALRTVWQNTKALMKENQTKP